GLASHLPLIIRGHVIFKILSTIIDEFIAHLNRDESVLMTGFIAALNDPIHLFLDFFGELRTVLRNLSCVAYPRLILFNLRVERIDGLWKFGKILFVFEP